MARSPLRFFHIGEHRHYRTSKPQRQFFESSAIAILARRLRRSNDWHQRRKRRQVRPEKRDSPGTRDGCDDPFQIFRGEMEGEAAVAYRWAISSDYVMKAI